MTSLSAIPLAVQTVLAAIAYLMVKHAVADFFVQTESQRREKGIYGATGGLTHSLTHIVLTAPVFLLLPTLETGMIAALLAAEFVLHYHIDWTKEQVVRRNGWTSHDTPFWWAIGLDQLLHGLTYVALLALALAASSQVSAA
jgi:Protein of unknown function (DUF3307)